VQAATCDARNDVQSVVADNVEPDAVDDGESGAGVGDGPPAPETGVVAALHM
jgi:hypothetical protein